MNKIFLPLLFIILLSSCVSEETHNKILNENSILKKEITELKKEIYDLKFGIPNLFSETKKLMNLNEFIKAKYKIKLLETNYPNAIETTEAKKFLPKIKEELAWIEAEKSNNINQLEKYRNNYKKGKYYNIASKKIKRLKIKKQKNAYENAVKKNTSYVWSNYINEYPNDPRRYDIKKKIIKLKVDEIISDNRTGNMPSFSKTDYSYSSISNVSITNDTQYELIVRYSGPSIKSISIPRGQTRTTSLKSGSYKVAASAGGLNYGGRANLSGNYSSSYYITTTRY